MADNKDKLVGGQGSGDAERRKVKFCQEEIKLRSKYKQCF